MSKPSPQNCGLIPDAPNDRHRRNDVGEGQNDSKEQQQLQLILFEWSWTLQKEYRQKPVKNFSLNTEKFLWEMRKVENYYKVKLKMKVKYKCFKRKTKILYCILSDLLDPIDLINIGR